MYPQNSQAQTVIDITVEKLEFNGKILRKIRQVTFSYSVFCAWQDIPTDDPVVSKCNESMVFDIRGLNKMVIIGAYPMQLQDKVLAVVNNKKLITILDAIALNYQLRLHPQSRWELTIVTAKGQFTLKCLLIGYRNSNAYVQRQMDNILKEAVAKSCCDDIVIVSSDLY